MKELQSVFLDTKTGRKVAKNIIEPGPCGCKFSQLNSRRVWEIPIALENPYAIINIFVNNILVLPDDIIFHKIVAYFMGRTSSVV